MKLYVDALRAITTCKKCGNQPIEWHGEHHVKTSRLRISNMVDLGYKLDDVKKEISRCEPLCRSCHMKEDGRTKALILSASIANKGKMKVDRKKCSECENISLLVHGLCNKCYHKQYMRQYRKRKP